MSRSYRVGNQWTFALFGVQLSPHARVAQMSTSAIRNNMRRLQKESRLRRVTGRQIHLSPLGKRYIHILSTVVMVEKIVNFLHVGVLPAA